MTENATVLVVDDDPEIREIVRILLERENLQILEAADFHAALLMLEKKVDLIILDIMLPGQSGLELCREMRKITMAPILFLSAKARDSDKAKGLAEGGDDYLVKPFSQIELVSRVKALLRRSMVYQRAPERDRQVISVEELQMNRETGVVFLAGKELILTGTEYQMLRLLLENRGKIFTACEIYEHVWQEPFLPVSNNTVMVHMKNLRKKLEQNARHSQYIRTVWGKGYYIE